MRLLSLRLQNFRQHADTTLTVIGDRTFDCLFLPGGPGVKLLRADPRVRELVLRHHSAGAWLAAICGRLRTIRT